MANKSTRSKKTAAAAAASAMDTNAIVANNDGTTANSHAAAAASAANPSTGSGVDLFNDSSQDNGQTQDEHDSTPSPKTTRNLSPLEISLMACAKSQGACKVDFAKSLPLLNNPAPCTGQGDSAHYWTDQAGTIVQLKFPAVITTVGTNSKIGPYFNLLYNGINIATLKKTRAQFQLRPLSPDKYLEEAVACSAAALNGLLYMVSTVDDPDKRNDSSPFVTSFCREHDDLDVYVMLAITAPLFRNVPDVNAKSTMVTRSALEASSSIPVSPSKVRAAALKRGSATSESPKKANGTILLKDLPDPDRRYEALANANSLSGVTIHVPDIQDSQGRSIPPTEYENKLVDGTVVEVEVMPKLWVFRPCQGTPARSRDANGSHVYQLEIKKMKVMPYSDYVHSSFIDKGKHKASAELASPSKKPMTAASPASSLEWSDLTKENVMEV